MKSTIKACIFSLLFPILAHGQEVGWLRIDPNNREPLTHAAVWGGYEDGRFRLSHEAHAEWKAGAEALRIGQRPHSTWIGSVSFEQRIGTYTTSSLLFDPIHYPMDLVDLTRGTKSQQDLRLSGGFLADIDDIWAAGFKGSVRAEHASKRKGIPYGNIGAEAELEPVVTYVIDDNVGVSVSYCGRFRTENARAKTPGEGAGSEGLYLDKGMRYVDPLTPGGGAFSILEFAHGFRGEFHSEEESWGVDMLWKRGRANGYDNAYRFPGSTLHAFFEYVQSAENTSHLFGVSYQRDRDQLRLVGADGAFSALSDRVDRNAGLKYRIRFRKGVMKDLALVVDGKQATERAMPGSGFYDKTLRYDGTATLRSSLSYGLFDLDVDLLAGRGWWKDRGKGDPSQTSGAPLRLTENWFREMEALMAMRIGAGGSLTCHIPAVDGLFLRLQGSWRRALKVSYLPGKNREAITLTVGYDY